MLAVRDLEVRYDAVTAVDRVSFDVASGETLAIVGASGSGKSTLLRAIAGLLVPSAGAVAWEGQDLADVPAHHRGFGLLFQDHALFPHLDVGANVAFGLRMAGMGDAEVRQRVSQSLLGVGLSGYEGRRIDELSGGQAQRVALARTVAPEPRLLLLDEPLGSLDPALRKQLGADLKTMLDASSVPALLVTHDIEEAFELADRIAVLDAGSIVRIGSPNELWFDPGTAAVASILGHSILRPGDDDGALRLFASDHQGALAVRPDALTPDPTGRVEGTVVGVAFRGPGYIATVEVLGSMLSASHADRPGVGGRGRYSVNETAAAPIAD